MSITMDSLTVSHRSRSAVHHVSAEFADQLVQAVFGPNRAGKSALLKAVVGLQKTDTGCARRIGLRHEGIAYLPQQSETDHNQPMAVFELAAMGLWYEIDFFSHVNAGQRQCVFDALERVEVVDFAEWQIAHLSNGQFQRALFTRMLVQDAKFLLLGELFNTVDAKTAYALLEVLVACHTEERAVIVVLHDYEQVRAYFADTLPLTREKIAVGAMEVVLTEEYLRQADTAIQRHGSAD